MSKKKPTSAPPSDDATPSPSADKTSPDPADSITATKLHPAHVITRVTGCGRYVAEGIVARLGKDADQLLDLYAADDVDGIHKLIAPPEPTKK